MMWLRGLLYGWQETHWHCDEEAPPISDMLDMYMNECKLIPLDQGIHKQFAHMTLPCQAIALGHLPSLHGMVQPQI